VEITREDSHAVLAAYARNYSAASSGRLTKVGDSYVSAEAIEAGRIYDRDIAPRIDAGEPSL
jgi:hypothetical protein